MNEEYYPIEFSQEDSSFLILNEGTAPSPCVITIIPKVDFLSLNIEGLSASPIKVARVYANEVLVIDGENRTVMIDDEPAFDRYDAFEFPKVQPGENRVKIPGGSNCSVAIEYNARYI